MEPNNELKLTELPFAWTLQTEKLDFYCSFCLKSGEDVHLLRCGKCKISHYCDSPCQKTDWILHKNECKRFCRLLNRGKQVSDDFVRLFGRIYDILSMKNDRKNVFSSHESRSFDDLMSHEREISKDEYNEFMENFINFVPVDDDDETKMILKNKNNFMKLRQIYGKLKVNSFGIKNEELQSIGIGLYLNLCRLDHSCVPNARIIFKGREAVVVSVDGKDLRNCQSYDQIRHSYIDNLASLDERRELLMKDYYFLCECDGCKNDERNEIMEAFSCDSDGCHGYVSLNSSTKSCKLCGNPLNDVATAKMVLELTKEILKKWSLKFSIEAERKFEICSKTAAMQTGTLYEFNIYKMLTIRHTFAACVELKRWSDAGIYGENLLNIYRNFLSSKDPYLFVFAKNLAVVNANANCFESAKSLLCEFKSSYVETFGAESKFVKNVNSILERISQ